MNADDIASIAAAFLSGASNLFLCRRQNDEDAPLLIAAADKIHRLTASLHKFSAARPDGCIVLRSTVVGLRETADSPSSR
ncbi:MAG: hypothetical protein ACRDD1_15640, partial [Planctomycetia bacterium]